MHAGRQNADDGVRFAVHANVFADEIAVSAEVLGPHSMTENHHVISSEFTFFRKKVASEQERQSFHREKSGRTPRSRNLLRPVIGCNVERSAAPCSHSL